MTKSLVSLSILFPIFYNTPEFFMRLADILSSNLFQKKNISRTNLKRLYRVVKMIYGLISTKGKTMKYVAILSSILLAGCAQVMASNPESITIKAPPAAEGLAFQKAQQHCAQFKKDAVPTGTVFGNSTVFHCK